MKLTLILLLVACSLIAHSQPPFVEFVGKGKPSSQLKPAFCNQNINSWTQIIEANAVPGANMYRFKITDAVTGLYEIIETPVPQFTLSQLTMALVPQHALTVSVAYRVGVKWFPYGPTCLIKPKFVETWCGFDPILDNLLEVPGNQEILDQQLNEIIEKTNQSQTKSTYIYTIPVVFHIVDNGPITTADFVTNTDIYDQLALLNTAFENLLFSTNSAAADIEVRFCLAKQIVDDAGVVIGDETDWGPYWTGYTGGESVTYGITRTSSAISDAHEIDTDIANPNGMVGLANLISFPYERYLNIWIVNSITDDTGTGSILGYSPYPIMSILSTLTPEEQGLLDGVVVRSDGFINGTHPTMNSGKVLVHEVGHYLKLYHVWTDACHSPTDCATMGDFICDTPPQYEPDWNGCNTLSNTCDPAIDPHDNHMSYAQESCKNTFTLDQKNRMHAIIGLYRSNLVSTENLSLTAPDCIDPLLLTDIISTTSDNICTGGSVSFMSTPTPAPGTFVWNFPGGIPATSTSGSPTVTYTSPGIYDVSITITSGLTNTVINEIQSVYVSDCNPVSSNLGNWFYGQQVGLNFASGIAQNTTYFVVPPVNNISTPESATSYSDDAGNLVLYSDGNTIYNQLHAVMAGHSYGDVDGNDYVPLSSGSSAHRGVVAFEDPNNVNTPGEVGYYVFHTSSAENMPANGSNNHGLGYSHVLVNSINPLGIVDEINIRPLENYSISECVAAVSHCNGRDFWVMVQGSQYNLSSNPMTENPGPLYSDQQNYFFAYLVDPSGLNGTPTASIKAPTAKSNTDFFTTYKFSPDGNIFSVLTTHSDNTFDIFFYQFDRSNGSLSFLTSFDIPDNNSSYYNHRDLEYSPDGNVLYVLTTAGLYQVDISSVLLAPTSFNYTFTDLDQIQHYALELAPDQRIYITSQISSTKLSVINFPNNMNTSSWSNECGLNINSFHYDYSRFNNLSFQNQVRQIDNTAGGFEYTQQNCFEFDFIPNQCGTSYFWDFGGLGTSTDYTPTFTFPSEGNYIVELTVDGNTSIETISITEPNASIVGNPVIACGNEFPVDFFASPNGDYLFDWSFTGGLPNSGNLNFISVILEDPFGDLTLTITDPATGCTSTTTTHIISGCCPGTVQIDHPFKMNSTTPGRSEGFDVALDLTQDLVYYAGNFNADMSLGTYNLTASTPKENFIAQLYEDNCLGWLKQYPIFVSTQTLSPIETYVFKTRPINVQTTSSGQVFMANQVYGHSYIASVDPVTGNQTILFNLFNDAIPGSGSNIITDFVIDEANSRIVFIATINSSLLDFAPAFVGAPVSRVFVGSISYIGTPLSYNFLTTDVLPVSCSRNLCLTPAGDFITDIQTNINSSNIYLLNSLFTQTPSPMFTISSATSLEITDMQFSDVTNQIGLIGIRRGALTLPYSLPMTGIGPFEAFLTSFDLGTSTPFLQALDKTFDFTYPGIALIGGDIIYQYGNQNLSITALEYGQWTPGGANTIINTAEFSSGSTIKAGPIKFHPGENVLYSNGTFFEDLDFDGTLLLANGSPSSAMTFYAAKVSSSTGDFTAMILNETDYDLSQEKDILANPTATSELSVTEFSENFKLLIVPNPNNGKFQIVLPEMKGTYSEVKIRNMSGELLYELKLGHDEGTIEIEDLGLSSGIYMVSVKINDIEYRSRVVITL